MTDATAAVLRRVKGLPSAIVAAACACDQAAVGDDVDVWSQQPAGDGWIDLEFRVPAGFLVWIEIKDWAPVSGAHQLELYMQALSSRTVPTKRLVYLPRPGASDRLVPGVADVPTMIRWDWERFGTLVQDWLRDNREALDAVQLWLLGDYVEYLT